MKSIATPREDFHLQVKYRIFAFLSLTINNITFFLLCIGIPVDVYQYLVADDWSSIKVEGPEHTVIEIEGFPDYPFDSGTFQVAFKAKRIAPCRFLTGTKFVFKQPKSDRYGVSKENAITHLTAEESLKELERQNETKTAKVNSVFKMALELKINPAEVH